MPRGRNVPILFSAGRTPLSEAGVLGSRDRHIHWAQESYDQAGMVREFVKWDYELRNFAQLETVVDRALALAQAEPPGPVYLTLPREVLAERHETFEYAEPSRLQKPGLLRPAPGDIDDAAQLLAGARNPIIITKATGRDPVAVPALVKLAETLGAPVFQDSGHNYMNFPGNHPLHARLRRGRASRGGRRHPRRRGGRALVPAHQEPAPGDAASSRWRRTRSSPAIRSAASRAT